MGDGTTSVVLLAGEILKHVKGFVEDGLHPQVRRPTQRRCCLCCSFVAASFVCFVLHCWLLCGSSAANVAVVAACAKVRVFMLST